MNMRSMIASLCVAFLPFCFGCAVTNEGGVDVRKAELVALSADRPHFRKLVQKNVSLQKGQAAVFERNVDRLSLHLRTVFLAKLPENPITPFLTHVPGTRKWGRETGEIAIVANVIEDKDGDGLEFTSDAMKTGRVVFYSDDVEQYQWLNMNNLPMYGPMTYRGAPVVFRLQILELDATSEQMKAMLGVLATVGSAAYPPASPVLGVLNTVGQSLVDNDQDDTEFRYTMVLDAQGGDPRINHFKLEPGNYVFVRMEDRAALIPWDELVLNENDGRLYELVDGKPGPLFTDETYVVVEVNRNAGSIDIELQQNNFEALRDALRKEDKARAARIRNAGAVLKDLILEQRSVVAFSEASDLLKKANEPDPPTSFERQQYARLFLEMIKDQLDANGKLKTDGSAYLSEDQVDSLLRRMRRHFPGTDIGRAEVGSMKIDALLAKIPPLPGQ